MKTAREARTVLMATPGRRKPDAAAVRGDRAAAETLSVPEGSSDFVAPAEKAPDGKNRVGTFDERRTGVKMEISGNIVSVPVFLRIGWDIFGKYGLKLKHAAGWPDILDLSKGG